LDINEASNAVEYETIYSSR